MCINPATFLFQKNEIICITFFAPHLYILNSIIRSITAKITPILPIVP